MMALKQKFCPMNNNANQSFTFTNEKKKNEPFRRVRTEEVEIDERIKDMSFEAKVSRVVVVVVVAVSSTNWPENVQFL